MYDVWAGEQDQGNSERCLADEQDQGNFGGPISVFNALCVLPKSVSILLSTIFTRKSG